MCDRVAWSAVPNGRKGTANVFTLRANDIKRVPEPAEPDADDQETTSTEAL